MGKRPSFSDLEKYDKEIQRRQTEIKKEINVWSQSNEFSDQIEKIIKKTMESNEQIRSLSKYLHEHEPFQLKLRSFLKMSLRIPKSPIDWAFLTNGRQK